MQAKIRVSTCAFFILVKYCCASSNSSFPKVMPCSTKSTKRGQAWEMSLICGAATNESS